MTRKRAPESQATHSMIPEPTVLVVGSLNVDHTFRVPRIPTAGETLTATGAFTCFGGKGANQAIAAVRAGADAIMIGCIGDDESGNAYRDHLIAEGIDTTNLVATPDIATGSAFITVDDAGENSIVVHPGANHALTPEMIDAAAPAFSDADVLLLQLECPLPAVKRAAELAVECGAMVIINPSPWNDALRDAGIPVDIFILNESETRSLTGRDPATFDGDPADYGCNTMIITRGARPTLAICADGTFEFAPPTVTPIDTVGAGDTFAGAFAVARAEGRPLREAVEFANHAAALAILRPGAQTAIPTRDQITASKM